MFVLRGRILDDGFFHMDKIVYLGPEDKCAAYFERQRVIAMGRNYSLCVTSGNGIGAFPGFNKIVGIKKMEVGFKAYRPKKRNKDG